MTSIRATLVTAAALVTIGIVCMPSALAAGARHFSGIAAYYDQHYHGRTASGRRYDPHAFTAAHRSLPFGTRLKVTDTRNGRSVEVVVTDRGPFNRGRVIDLSLAAAKKLRMLDRGLVRITADVMH